jgi:lipoprotein-releasing system ATP-binding protein
MTPGRSEPQPLLIFGEVSKNYPDAEYGRVTALSRLSFKLSPGEMVAVTGPSGSGKTTLLNLAGGLDRPSSGEILFKGKNVAEFDESELAGYRNAEIGFVFQEHRLLPQCDVLENVIIPRLPAAGRGQRGAESDAETRALELLASLGMERFARRFPNTLSGGERQRVAIARALINSPALILADEPTGALDKANTEALADLLFEVLTETGAALLLATHSEHLAAKTQRQIRLDGVNTD